MLTRTPHHFFEGTIVGENVADVSSNADMRMSDDKMLGNIVPIYYLLPLASVDASSSSANGLAAQETE